MINFSSLLENAGPYKPPGQFSWWGKDSEAFYQKNLETLPSNWYYRTNTVTYTVNSMGYRAPEFDLINWQDSIVVFGCSSTFGDGVDDLHTIPSQINLISGIPTVNLGAGGSSILWALHNSMLLKKNFGVPKAVVFLWTSPFRTLSYVNGQPLRHGPWDPDEVFTNWIKNDNAEYQTYMIRNIVEQMWSKSCIFYDTSNSPDVQDIIGGDAIEWLHTPNDQRIHYLARDLAHNGPNQLEHCAKQIVDKLKERGLQC